MRLRDLLEALGLPVWMVSNEKLDKIVVLPEGEAVAVDQDREHIYVY